MAIALKIGVGYLTSEFFAHTFIFGKFSRFAGAKVIFATTTPLVEAVEADDNTGTGVKISGKNETVIEYNNAAKALMKTEGVTVNDLYEFCIKHPTCYKCEDLLHHSHEGNLACAKVIAEAIKKELNIND